MLKRNLPLKEGRVMSVLNGRKTAYRLPCRHCFCSAKEKTTLEKDLNKGAAQLKVQQEENFNFKII